MIQASNNDRFPAKGGNHNHNHQAWSQLFKVSFMNPHSPKNPIQGYL